MDIFHYDCNLNIEGFSHMLDDPSQSYKFYWLDAIVTLVGEKKKQILSFDEIFNWMIAGAWFSVTEYHLHLGNKRLGDDVDALEQAVNELAKLVDVSSTASAEDVVAACNEKKDVLVPFKTTLSQNVPYRALSFFLKNDLAENGIEWGQISRIIAYLDLMSKSQSVPYTISKIKSGRYVEYFVNVDDEWATFIRDNYIPIKGWIKSEKANYLQGKNIGVPGIINKLEPDDAGVAHLDNARKLWAAVMNISPITDMYLRTPLNFEDCDIDHFIPRHYIANDELWNLSPMDSSLNRSKNKRLPIWDTYFPEFANRQYLLYRCIGEYPMVKELFRKCYKNNICSLWASEQLYIPGNSEEEFKTILEKNMHPVYDAARLQGFSIWNEVPKTKVV